jgi:chemotaxis protein MotB
MISPEGRPNRSGEEDGNYLASMSDLMVGMLFIFIIMLMAFALSYRRAQEHSDQERADLLDQKSALECLIKKNKGMLDALLSEIDKALSSEGVDVEADTAQGILRMKDKVLFDQGSADLRREGQAAIGKIVEEFDSRMRCYIVSADDLRALCPVSSAPIIDGVFIEGHTDNDPVLGGRYRSNWELSTARAINTFQAMESADPAFTHLLNARDDALFGVSGYGETRPLNANGNAAEKQRNRRIDIRFLLRTPTQADVENAIQDAAKTPGDC